MLKINHRGTAIIETIIGMGLSLLLFGSSLLLLYFCFAFIWTKHSLYQGVLCRAEGQSARVCQTQLKKKIKLALPIGQIKKISLKNGASTWNGTLDWRIYSSLGFFLSYEVSRKQILRAAKISGSKK